MNEKSWSVRDGRQRQRGYNVVEVLIATAMLGAVLLSVVTLFFLGKRNVYAGKQTTNAVAVGTRVLEDLSPLSKQMIYFGAFAIADNASGADVSIGGRTYANSRLRSTNATVISPAPTDISTKSAVTGAPDFLATWGTLVQDALGPGSSVSLVMTPVEDPVNSPAQFRSALAMQIRVIIIWREGNRNRSLVLDSLKPY